MAKVFANLSDAKSLFEGASTKKGGMRYTVGQRFSFPDVSNDADLEKILGFEVVQGTPVPCLILDGGVLFLSSLTKRVYTYTCDGDDKLSSSRADGEFECTGFVENSESEVFKLVASCANQLKAVEALAGKTIEIDSISMHVSASGDFVEENGRTSFIPTKLVERQLPHWKFV